MNDVHPASTMQNVLAIRARPVSTRGRRGASLRAQNPPRPDLEPFRIRGAPRNSLWRCAEPCRQRRPSGQRRMVLDTAVFDFRSLGTALRGRADEHQTSPDSPAGHSWRSPCSRVARWHSNCTAGCGAAALPFGVAIHKLRVVVLQWGLVAAAYYFHRALGTARRGVARSGTRAASNRSADARGATAGYAGAGRAALPVQHAGPRPAALPNRPGARPLDARQLLWLPARRVAAHARQPLDAGTGSRTGARLPGHAADPDGSKAPVRDRDTG